MLELMQAQDFSYFKGFDQIKAQIDPDYHDLLPIVSGIVNVFTENKKFNKKFSNEQ